MEATEKKATSSHSEVSWDDLETPGFYVSRETGNGYRVPAEALIKGASPVIEQVSNRPSRLVKVSENPFIPLIGTQSGRKLQHRTQLLTAYQQFTYGPPRRP